MRAEVRKATEKDIDTLVTLAALTFPLACPPGHTPENIASHLRHVFSVERFLDYATSSDVNLNVATVDDGVVGFSLVDYRPSNDADVQQLLALASPYAELSKLFVHPDFHGAGVARSLLTTGINSMAERKMRTAWLTVSQLNVRANAFYEKSGFTMIGTKQYIVGDVVDEDYLRVRVLTKKG
jgi:ribosomal protein S18 acetylase RimI-like enzyme